MQLPHVVSVRSASLSTAFHGLGRTLTERTVARLEPTESREAFVAFRRGAREPVPALPSLLTHLFNKDKYLGPALAVM